MKTNSKLAKLEVAKSQVRTHLAEYIGRHRNLKSGQNFCCLSPTHEDKDPSCGVVRGNTELFHCFGCGAVGDIFVAANMLENRPLRGPGFVAENLTYLAQMFGVDVPTVTLSDDERHDMDTYRAYAIASQILVTSSRSERISAKILEYGWSAKTMADLGIGSVASYEGYMNKMTKVYGFDKEFLRSIDLDNKRIFTPDNLVFTVCDEMGAPVGFASRNLLYDSLAGAVKRAVEEFGEGSEQEIEARKKLPSKFVNSAQATETELKNRIYQKGTRLFGFHIAKHNSPPLYVFEGYGDQATAYNAGLHSGCAIGSTSFSEEHLNMVLDQRIDTVIFVLDADKAGTEGTERFVKLVEDHLGGHVGLKVQIIIMPEGSDDPDAMIRKQGLAAFMALEKVDVFTWKLKQSVAAGVDPDRVVETTLGLIVNEQNQLKRLRMAEKLSETTGVPQDVIWSEVLRRCDLDRQQIKAELSSLADSTVKKLQRQPDKVHEILNDSTRQAERISTLKQAYDLGRLVDYVDIVLTEAEAHVENKELDLGWPLFDEMFGGIPKSDAFITIPGKPNQGKSSFIANVAHRLVDHNEDVIVLYHTIDDNMRLFVPRLLGSRYRVPSEYFFKSGYYLQQNPLVRVNGAEEKVPFREVYDEGRRWFKRMLTDGRLLPYDVTMLDQNILSLEMRVRDLRKSNPKVPIVVFGDNFHQYTSGVQEEGEAKVRGLSVACKNMANQQHVTLIMTMELPKAALTPGQRPRMSNIKGSAGISYDASANIGVYNDMKDLRDAAELTWDDSDVERCDVEPGQTVTKVRRPILEMVFDKSKVNRGFDGNIYYQLHPPSGQVMECCPEDQTRYRAKAIRYEERNRQGGGQRPPHGAGAGFGFEAVESHTRLSERIIDAGGLTDDTKSVF